MINKYPILNKTVDVLKPIKSIDSIGVLWSATNINILNPNDIDLLLLTHNNTSSQIIKAFQDTYEYINHSICDDAIRINMILWSKWYLISVVPKEIKWFIEDITKICIWKNIERVNKPWAAWGYIPEILLSDISKSYILYDKWQLLTNIKNNLNNHYPILLKENLMESLSFEILIKYNQLQNSQNNQLLTAVLESDLIIALIRFLYVTKEIYFIWLKHIPSFPTFKEIMANIDIAHINKIEDIEIIIKYLEKNLPILY